MQKHQRTCGFSLLETSIVLVILGIMVGGILVGRSILATSRMQIVITDANNFITAIGQFKQTYQGLPGDFPNATAMWGTDSSTCPTGGGATGTCSGNGDGKVGGYCTSGSLSLTYVYEVFRVWQHLKAAGLYDSKLSGVTSSGNISTTVGSNIPASSVEGGGFSLLWLDDPSLCTNVNGLLSSSGAHGNVLVLANKISETPTPNYTFTPTLTPAQAASIDSKMDDSVPGTGNVRSFGSGTTGCTTTNVASTAAYALSTSSVACAPIFLTGY